MSLNTRMNAQKSANATNVATRNNLMKGSKSYRADCLKEAWLRVPGIREGMDKMDEATVRNLAINLDREATYIGQLNEAQLSTAFQGFAPENMLRLVRLAMPNLVRNKLFTEFAMETARDSIKYLKPILTKNQKGEPLDNRATDQAADDYYGYKDTDFSNEAAKYHKALYEVTEDRYVQELINLDVVKYGAFSKDTDGKVTFTEDDTATVETSVAYTAATATDPATATITSMVIPFEGGAFDANTSDGVKKGAKLIDGYGVVYFGDETHPVAIQYKTNNEWVVCAEFAGTEVRGSVGQDDGVYVLDVDFAGLKDKELVAKIYEDLTEKGKTPAVFAYARADLEDDFEGDYLGEVELRMASYEFRPRPTSIGVTWSQLSELTLDASFSVSVEEELVTYAAQEIRVALDYKAIRLAYQQALRNGKDYFVTFDAAVGSKDDGINAFGYKQNAQTFVSAVAKVEDTMLNDINRGGVSRMIAGPSAGSYCYLLDSFTDTGAMPNIGCHQIGTIMNGIPVFKVPSSIIPNNRIVTVFKNEANEADVSMVFGTLVPFFSTGTIQRKNFYKEAGIASYGDWNCLNPKYLGIIQINNIKDQVNN